MTQSHGKSISQTRPGENVSPTPGKRFNFSSILKGVLIPAVILCHPYLCPGARLLWGILRALSYKRGYCDRTDAALAQRLYVSERQIRRYVRQLARTGLIEVVERPGHTPERATLWHAIFEGAPYTDPDTSVHPPGHIRPPERTEMSVDKRSSVVLPEMKDQSRSSTVETRGPWERQLRQVSHIPIPLPPDKPAAENPLPAAATPSQKSGKHAGDQDVVERAIRAFGVEPTRTLLLKLQDKADYWHATNFQVAAALERIRRRVERSPSSAPHQLRWFLTVLENELKSQSAR